MNKRFNSETNPDLLRIIDNIETTLKCLKFQEYKNVIDIDTWENINFKMPHNKQLAENGFGFCISNFHEYGDFKRIIVINMENCKRAGFNEREIASVVFHELGHLLNAPEEMQEPTLLYCYMKGINYSKALHDEIKIKNAMNNEIYADSYANLYGYGSELIMTFNKQNELFNQKIGYFDERVKNLENEEFFEGIVKQINKKGW